MGLVQSSWPGTAAEEWTDAPSMAGEPDFAAIHERWRAVEEATKGVEDRPSDFDVSFDDVRLVPGEPRAAEPILVGGFRKGTLHNDLGVEWTYSWESAPLSRVELSPAGPPAEGWVLRSAGQLRFNVGKDAAYAPGRVPQARQDGSRVALDLRRCRVLSVPGVPLPGLVSVPRSGEPGLSVSGS